MRESVSKAIRVILIYVFSYVACCATFAFQILFFGFVHGDWHSLAYIVLLEIPDLTIMISMFIASYVIWKHELQDWEMEFAKK